MPEHDSNDKLTLTLDALRSDIERTPTADSMTVRRRGDQRTRRQAVGGALAVVAMVAGVAGFLGGAGGFDRADAPPATRGPTASTAVETPLALAAQPLFLPEDFGAVGPYTDWKVSSDPAAADQRLSLCLPHPGTLGAVETRSRLLFGDLEGTATEHVLLFDDPGNAGAAVRALTSAFADCDPGDPAESQVVDRQPRDVPGVEGVDTAVHASRTATPVLASEVSYYEVGVVRRANVVVVLQWQAGPVPSVDWVWDAGRLTAALDRAVG